jgi:hypothetical protein
LLEAVEGLGVDISGNVPELLVSRPGVALKTEYSSAKVGVHPERLSKELFWFRGVWNTGLGKAAEVGVWLGVGG